MTLPEVEISKLKASSRLVPENCLIYEYATNLIKGINYDRAAQMIHQNFDIVRRADSKECFIYSGGVYRPYGWDALDKALYKAFGGYKKKNGQSAIDRRTSSEILTRAFALRTEDPEYLEFHDGFLNVKNGLLGLDSRKLIEHMPEIYSFTQMDVSYNPDAESVEFLGFMDDMVDPKYQPVVQELFGYVLWPDYNIHKGFMLLGPKRSGKSTTLNVLEALVGKDSTSHVSLQSLVKDRFSKANLFGKAVNIYGDLPREIIVDPGVFMALTGQDPIEAERKFQHPFNFKNKAKLVYSTNELPALKHESEAYYSRWIIIPYDKSVYGHEDTQLIKRLTTPLELSGILNWSLDGLDRLRANGWQFSYKDDSIALYRRKSKPILAFLEDRCEPSYTDYVVKSDLILEYNKWAKNLGLPPATSKKAFGTVIGDQGIIPVTTCYPQVNDGRPEAWKGIRLRTT
jgi:putative DNA primase/helicase